MHKLKDRIIDYDANKEAADRWLIRWLPLFNKYTDRKFYSDYYFQVHCGFNEEPYCYTGQLI